MLKCELPLKWKNPAEMPLGPSIAQVVVIEEKIYIGGGDMRTREGAGEGSEEESGDGQSEDLRAIFSVLECIMTGEGPQWKTIVAPTIWFGMAEVNKELIIAGGMDTNNELSDQVFVLNSHSKTWIQPFPPSSLASVFPSAISYNRWLILVGGSLEPDINSPLDVVQLLDTRSRQWYRASALPSPTMRPSLAIIQDTLYVALSNVSTPKALQLYMPTLLEHVKSAIPILFTKPADWQVLPHTLTSFPFFVSFDGHLLAVSDSETPSSVIAMYLPNLKLW